MPSGDLTISSHHSPAVAETQSLASINPDFDPAAGHIHEQIRAAESFLAVEKWVVDRLHNSQSRPDSTGAPLAASSTGSLHSIFNSPENEIIEKIYNAVGPLNPFAGLPVLNVGQLEPGDIIVSTYKDALGQAIRIGTWSLFSHAALYIGNGLVEQSGGGGVGVASVSALLEHASLDGVIRDVPINATQRQAVATDAMKYNGRPYNWDGLEAIAIKKAARLLVAPDLGIRTIISVLTKPETIPHSLDDGRSFFCSQLVVKAYTDAGVPLHTTNGASPGDIVRLSEYDTTLEELGSLPLGAPQ